jgi:hypothetical protein
MFIAALMIVLVTASAASAVIYIKVKGDKGTVYWADKGLSGYFEYVKDGGGHITFVDGNTAYISDRSPTGFAIDISGKMLDNYYIYTFNPDSGKYEYKEGDEVITLPED